MRAGVACTYGSLCFIPCFPARDEGMTECRFASDINETRTSRARTADGWPM